MSIDWTRSEAPSLDDIDKIARAAFASLPERFRGLCSAVPFVVQDFPDGDVITELDLETEFDILGLFQGPDLAAHDSAIERPEPTLIFLYRRPILDYWAEHQISLGDIIRHVLIHEIGHHFGLSDEDMAKIEEG
jgi:predicted Zn-dependent protease with MMP-like domain